MRCFGHKGAGKFLLLPGISLLASLSLHARAQEPFKGPLDPVTSAYRDAANLFVTAPSGKVPNSALKQAVQPALSERARQNKKKRNAELATWHTHRRNGEAGTAEAAPLLEDETILSGEGIPAEIDYAGPKKTQKRAPLSH